MINADLPTTSSTTTTTTGTTPLTPVAPTFPTHNPAMQHKQFMTGAPAATTTTTTSNPISTMPPTTPKFPDPTRNLINVAGTTTQTVTGSSSGGKDTSKPKKKVNMSLILGTIILILIVVGSGVGFYLTQQVQELRQQAVLIDCTNFNDNEDDCIDFGCKWSPYVPGVPGKCGPEGTSCPQLSEAGCNAASVCSWTDPVPPKASKCISPAATPTPAPTATPIVTIAPAPTATPPGGEQCNEQCPGSDGILRNCTPPSADGTPQESICNLAGRVESCAGQQYCCPSVGGTWTTNMTLCQAPVLTCNDVCTSNTQCPSGQSCLATYNFSSGFTDVTINVANVGSGPITGFGSAILNGTISQYLTRDGKIWYRPNTISSTPWTDVTANVANVGSGIITSFNTWVQTSGAIGQYLTRGGKIWYRPNTNSSTPWTDVTANVANVGSGTIKAFSAQNLSPDQGSLTSSYLVRGNKIWANFGNNSSGWVDATSNVINYGSGDFTDFHFLLDLDKSIKHYFVRGGKIWYRNAPVESSKRCRLPSYPNATNCQPPTPSLQCNSDCTTNTQCSNALGTGYSCVTNKCRLTSNPTSTTCTPAVIQCNSDCTTTAQCAAVNPAWSCVSNKCRLTENPSSTTCSIGITPPPACQDVAILDQNNNIINPTATPNPFFIGQIIKLRCAADNPASSLIQKYEFRITEPGGTIIQGTALNPAGKTVTSLNYQINKSGAFKAQCRICLTNGSCQPYLEIN